MFLCLDYGDRYIGIAATDQDGNTPYRYGTIDQNESDALDAIKQIVEKEGTTTVLVDIPMSLQGGETDQTHKTLAFMEDVREALPETVEVEAVDEMLSSVEAQRMLQAEGAQKADEHAEAARLVLVDYLAQQQEAEE